MTGTNPCAEVEYVVRKVGYPGRVEECRPFGDGHINDTFAVRCRDESGAETRYVLQRINHEIFKDPVQVMDNVVYITEFLRGRLLAAGEDPDRGTISYLRMPGGGYCYRDSIGSYWRSYRFIENAVSFDTVQCPEDFYQSAVAFGRFQRLLADFDASHLTETIPDFHNTPVRYERFCHAVEQDACGRAESVRQEIEFVRSRAPFMSVLTDLLKSGGLPLRVTHNDTKLNNVLFDKDTRKAICVIDLDTVMPGLSVYDFGDSIRFGATTAAEDEPDLSRVNFDRNLFELYTKGYLEGCGGSLTETERRMMPEGAKMMTLECGMRFLTDYLEGDHYFKISRPQQNLDRARTQFKLVSDMESCWDEMHRIVEKY
ncbi:MAG: aminoglycoside phosphotransferase family protein [Firmicutes bacterium]|nr:aminoglycoside phosphotransferase family protein [Bacillota bacterium]